MNSDRVSSKDKLLLWLWQTFVMATSGNGGPEPGRIQTSALLDY